MHGVDLATVDIEVSVGRAVSVEPTPAKGVAASRYFTVAEPSVLADRDKLHEQLLSLPGCREVEWHAVADEVLRPAVNFRQRFGHIVVVAPDPATLEATLAEADRLVTEALRPS